VSQRVRPAALGASQAATPQDRPCRTLSLRHSVTPAPRHSGTPRRAGAESADDRLCESVVRHGRAGRPWRHPTSPPQDRHFRILSLRHSVTSRRVRSAPASKSRHPTGSGAESTSDRLCESVSPTRQSPPPLISRPWQAPPAKWPHRKPWYFPTLSLRHSVTPDPGPLILAGSAAHPLPRAGTPQIAGPKAPVTDSVSQ
jgi:hypothetical protein